MRCQSVQLKWLMWRKRREEVKKKIPSCLVSYPRPPPFPPPYKLLPSVKNWHATKVTLLKAWLHLVSRITQFEEAVGERQDAQHQASWKPIPCAYLVFSFCLHTCSRRQGYMLPESTSVSPKRPVPLTHGTLFSYVIRKADDMSLGAFLGYTRSSLDPAAWKTWASQQARRKGGGKGLIFYFIFFFLHPKRISQITWQKWGCKRWG